MVSARASAERIPGSHPAPEPPVLSDRDPCRHPPHRYGSGAVPFPDQVRPTGATPGQ
ncbi:hypothetical protein NFA_5890 [Nocardia farcinica IFM 10152]|uniref:Uncharacterized protein n=1 Tax=Nocardia farcinica (strain IFM 10152) TaxID=247156 RepID=Q5Z2A7_NOCFA|nr:hypothetical protein NFA_5890 [Nocardia farcinica IFM 10152]